MRKRSESPAPDGEIAIGDKPFEGDRQFVSALHRGLEILRCFRPSDDGLGNQELSQRSGLGPSTVSRLTYTLTRLGYLRYDRRSGRYRLGVAVLGLGYTCLAGLGIRAAALPRMQALAEKLGSGILVSLSTRENLQMTYVACARGAGVMSLQLDVGSRIPLNRTAAGRAYLAGVDDEERERLMACLEEYERQHGLAGEAGWPLLEAEIREAIDQVRRRGYYASIGAWRPEVNSVGAPIHGPEEDGMVYGLTVGGLSHYLPRDRLEAEIAPLLVDLAARLSNTKA